MVHEIKGLRRTDQGGTTHERHVAIGTSQFGLPVLQQGPNGDVIHRLLTRRSGETLVAYAPSCD